MEGPRSIKVEEMPSLSRLVDVVFRNGEENMMFSEFPHYLSEDNAENLFVFVDEGRVVSHFGMTRRWGSVCGCTVGAACVGAVATYEEYRGKGLATRLFEYSRDRMKELGMDFMLISGGRGLYRRAGSADFGRDDVASIESSNLDLLPTDPKVELADWDDTYLSEYALAYAKKAVHFVRPLDDWRGFIQSGFAMGARCNFVVVKRDGVFAGYLVLSKTNKDGFSRVIELAGDESVLACALKPAMEKLGIQKLDLHLQPENTVLRTCMEKAGLTLQAKPNCGTLQIINFPQLMKRLKPLFEAQLGIRCAERLSFTEKENDVFVFCNGEEQHVIEGRMAAAEFIFGAFIERPSGSVWKEIFPVPGLWYGLNYT